MEDRQRAPEISGALVLWGQPTLTREVRKNLGCSYPTFLTLAQLDSFSGRSPRAWQRLVGRGN